MILPYCFYLGSVEKEKNWKKWDKQSKNGHLPVNLLHGKVKVIHVLAATHVQPSLCKDPCSRDTLSVYPLTSACQGELNYPVSDKCPTRPSQLDVHSLLQCMSQTLRELERAWSLWPSVAPGEGRDKWYEYAESTVTLHSHGRISNMVVFLLFLFFYFHCDCILQNHWGHAQNKRFTLWA